MARTAARSPSTAPPLAAQLRGLQRDSRRRLPAHGGQTFHAPRTLDELVGRARRPSAGACCWPAPPTSACGSPSSCANWATSSTWATSTSCKAVREHDGLHRDRRRRLPGRRLRRHLPPLSRELGELWQRFASLPIRNAGTLGGNVANGSPIGDSMPWLIALGAELVLRGPRRPSARWRWKISISATSRRTAAPANSSRPLRVPLPRAGRGLPHL